MFHRIPPVGNPISWSHPVPPPKLVADNEQCLFVQSGTAALAQALIIAKSAFTTDTPEVIVPGYACPDVISAAVYAGITPVLVDLEPNRPYMSLSAIENAVTDHTVAIIAVNFMGIPERIAAIRASLGDTGIIVIEDSAQWYPDADGETPISNCYQGDLVVLSFGKGKPISLMGGGALLIKAEKLSAFVEKETFAEGKNSHLLSPLKANLKTRLLYTAYNVAISNYGYWLLELLPWIKLGETHYEQLDEIRPIDNNRLYLLASNQKQYLNRQTTSQKALEDMLISTQQKLIALPNQCETYQGQRLLRYPILLPCSEARDKALTSMEKTGCGASRLYPTILSNIEGAREHVKQPSPLPNATNFASRLITLPTHNAVNNHHITAIQKALQLND
jgi:dTDP-4-amino-4,6-dideoxygalactose transaminase